MLIKCNILSCRGEGFLWDYTFYIFWICFWICPVFDSGTAYPLCLCQEWNEIHGIICCFNNFHTTDTHFFIGSPALTGYEEKAVEELQNQNSYVGWKELKELNIQLYTLDKLTVKQ